MNRTSVKRQNAKVINVKTWDEFMQKVRHNNSVWGRIFRGHRDVKWTLSSQFERWLISMKKNHIGKDVRILFSDGAFEKIRDLHLETYRYYLSQTQLSFQDDLDDRDLWIIGRHHGLITPFLDWTKSPYVAAFFAFTSHIENMNPNIKHGIGAGIYHGTGNIAVWQMRVTDDITKNNEFEVIYPKNRIPDRVNAQQGVFTYLKSYMHHDIESFLISSNLETNLIKYEIPVNEIGPAFADFELMNISYATLFPDYYGAAMQANMQSTLKLLARLNSFSKKG